MSFAACARREPRRLVPRLATQPGVHRGHVVNRHECDAGVPEVVGKGADRRVDDLVPRDYRQQLRFDQG